MTGGGIGVHSDGQSRDGNALRRSAPARSAPSDGALRRPDYVRSHAHAHAQLDRSQRGAATFSMALAPAGPPVPWAGGWLCASSSACLFPAVQLAACPCLPRFGWQHVFVSLEHVLGSRCPAGSLCRRLPVCPVGWLIPLCVAGEQSIFSLDPDLDACVASQVLPVCKWLSMMPSS